MSAQLGSISLHLLPNQDYCPQTPVAFGRLACLGRWSMSGSPAGTVASTASLTHVPVQSDTNDPHSPRLAGGEGASAIQGGTVGDKIEDIQNDWE